MLCLCNIIICCLAGLTECISVLPSISIRLAYVDANMLQCCAGLETLHDVDRLFFLRRIGVPIVGRRAGCLM